MVKNPKLISFIIVLLSFFTICFAEDFWMKLGFNEGADKMFYSSQDEIYITKSEALYYSFRSLDKGITWENYPEVLNYPFTIGGVEYISDDGNYLYVRSMDSLYIVHKDSSDIRKLLDLRFMTMSKIGHNFYFLTDGRIIKSDENLKDTTIVLETSISTEPFRTIIVDSLGTLFAGSRNYIGVGGIYKSFDNGDSWEWYPENLAVYTMAVDKEGRIFAGCYDKILRSTDNGDTWQNMQNIIAYPNCMLINSKDAVFIGFSADFGFKGIGYSDDYGVSWKYLNGGLSSDAGAINDIAISPDGYVYLATDGGVYRSINSTTGIESQDNSVSDCILYQNYPNPFNNETIINFNLFKACHVQLNIFNIKGELLKNIKNQKMGRGQHSVNFSSDNLGSGVYYYSLKVDNKTVSSKKMLYIR